MYQLLEANLKRLYDNDFAISAGSLTGLKSLIETQTWVVVASATRIPLHLILYSKRILVLPISFRIVSILMGSSYLVGFLKLQLQFTRGKQ